jgi:hypothetical protein
VQTIACSTKAALGEAVILGEPELHVLRLTPATLFVVAASDGITCAMSDDTIVNQVCLRLQAKLPAAGVAVSWKIDLLRAPRSHYWTARSPSVSSCPGLFNTYAQHWARASSA